jgi:hypothetical protein
MPYPDDPSPDYLDTIYPSGPTYGAPTISIMSPSTGGYPNAPKKSK